MKADALVSPVPGGVGPLTIMPMANTMIVAWVAWTLGIELTR